MQDDKIMELIKNYQRRKNASAAGAGSGGVQLPAGIDEWIQEVAEGALKMALDAGNPGSASADPRPDAGRTPDQPPPRPRANRARPPGHAGHAGDDFLENLQSNLAKDGFDINGEIEKHLKGLMGDPGRG